MPFPPKLSTSAFVIAITRKASSAYFRKIAPVVTSAASYVYNSTPYILTSLSEVSRYLNGVPLLCTSRLNEGVHYT
jgi:hypothetical protein